MRSDAVKALAGMTAKRISLSEVPVLINAISVASKQASSDDMQAIKSAIRLNMNLFDSVSLVRIAKLVTTFPQDVQLSLTSDLLIHATELVDSFSPNDALTLIKICGRMKLFDSDFLNAVAPKLADINIDQLGRLLGDCNKLRFAFSDSHSVVFSQVIRLSEAIVVADLRAVAVPLIEYNSRFIQSNTSTEGIVARGVSDASVKLVMKCLRNKVVLLTERPELLQQRAVVSLDSAFRLITSLGQLSRLTNETSLTDNERGDIVFILTKVLAYELRNLSLHQLVRLHFALSTIEVFDDFFVRRRLVPAILTAYKHSSNRSFRDTTLVLTMISQLPFTNAVVTELTEIALNDAERIKADDVLYEAVNDAIHEIRKK